MVLSSTTVLIFMLLGLIVGIFSGYYVFVVLGGLAVIFGLVFWGMDIFNLAFISTLGVMKNYTLLAVPLFVFMGTMLERSEVSGKLYDALSLVMGNIKGGLAVAALIISVLFASCTGIIGASVVTMGLLFLPTMLARGYDKSLACGVICGGGTLGVLIPPSIMLVLYGPTAGISVGKLFYSCLIPGLVLGFFYIAYVLVRCYLNPEMGPPMPPEERNAIPTKQKFISILINLVPVLTLIFSVLGVIWFGVASPTEAAAVGAFASMIIAAAYGKLNLKVLKETIYSTLHTSTMVLMIVVCASIFIGVFMRLGCGEVVQNALVGLPLSKWGVFALMMLVVFVLGFLMDWIASLLLIVPLFTPIANQLGFDPIWFATMVCLMYQTSFLTPPFAYSIFYLKGIAPPSIDTSDIIRGVWPLILLQIATIILCIIFPKIVLWLPERMLN